MLKKCWWIWLMIGAFLFRDQLMSLAGYEQGGASSILALLIAGIGGIVTVAISYILVAYGELEEASQVTALIIFGCALLKLLGLKLGQLPIIGEFWGGFITGVLEAAMLNGAVYGAKEVWQAKPK